jgi:hypothetical protein
MLDCVGSDPNGIDEFVCQNCKAEFMLRAGIEEDSRIAPQFCPFCGTPERAAN